MKDKSQIVGASEKRMRANALMRGKDPDRIESTRGKGNEQRLTPIIAIWGMAVVLGLLLSMGAIKKGGLSFHFADPVLDRWLLGSAPPPFLGDPDMDLLLASVVRGTAIFLAAAIVPFLTWCMMRVLRKDKKPRLVDFWAVILFLMSSALLLKVFKIV